MSASPKESLGPNKIPERLLRFAVDRPINDVVNEAKTQTPPSLRPYLKDYFHSAFGVCSSQPVDQMLKEEERLTGKLNALNARIQKLQTEINEKGGQDLNTLRQRRATIARKPELLPKTIRPAIGRLARTGLNVFLGIELPRPDVTHLDQQIASTESRLPIHRQLKEVEQQAIAFSQQTDQLVEKANAHFDSWAAQNPTRAIVCLSLSPERLIKIMREYQKRTLKDPSPEEAIWYVAWVLSTMRSLYEKNGLFSQLPETSKGWFKSLFPHIQSPSVTLGLFERPIEEFQKSTWSLLTPPPVDSETVEHVIRNLISSLKTPGFITEVRDFSSFVQWAFVTSAQNLGIFPEDQPAPAPTPEVCRIPAEKPKKEKARPITEVALSKEEEHQFPVICVSPYNSDKQLFLNPDGTIRLVIPGREIITGFTEEAVATVFNLKSQDPRAKIIWENLQKFQRRFYGLSRAGDMIKLDRPVLPGRIYADRKIRFGNWVFIYSIGKGQKGIPAYLIYAFGSHDEIFK